VSECFRGRGAEWPRRPERGAAGAGDGAARGGRGHGRAGDGRGRVGGGSDTHYQVSVGDNTFCVRST
jgi:hypothetical protein